VIARLFAVEETLSAAKPRLRELAATLTPARRPGDYAQAAMDLGATICAPRNPQCVLCPWREPCQARALGIQEELPRKRAKKDKPRRFGIVFWAARRDGAVLLRRRPDSGHLGGMMEFPSTPWREREWPVAEAAGFAPARVGWRALPGRVRHSFTHFDLELDLWLGAVRPRGEPGIWARPEAFSGLALPTLMKKIAAHALKATSLLEASGEKG